MSIYTEALGTVPTQSLKTWESLHPVETLAPQEQSDRLHDGVLELLSDERGLNEFLGLGGEITVSLTGDLVVTDPLVEALPQSDEQPTGPETKTPTYQRGHYVVNYLDFIAMEKNNAKQRAMSDYGNANDMTLDITDEQRMDIAEAVNHEVDRFMYEEFDDHLATFLLVASLTGDIDIQMNPADTATTIRQQHMWLDAVRTKLSYAHNIEKVRIVLVPFDKTNQHSA